MGDTVKKKLSDPQSGTVIATSIVCTLQPLLFNPHQTSWVSSGSRGSTRPPARGPAPILGVSAEDLRHCNEYDDGDYIIYNDWIGRVETVHKKVKLHIEGKGIVTVKDIAKLRRPKFTHTRDAKRCDSDLKDEGYIHSPHYAKTPEGSMERYRLLQPFFPGQMVQTDRDNLLPAGLDLGENHSDTSPDNSVCTESLLTGYVCEVRCVALDVSWIAANFFNEFRQFKPPPPGRLGRSILAEGRITIYDPNKIPQRSGGRTRDTISSVRTVAPGEAVRFRDPADAALKYDGQHFRPDGKPCGKFEPIPPRRSGGYDMNVFVVTRTHCQALIQWQNDTTSLEDSRSLSPYEVLGDHNVYPGQVVQLKDAARRLNQGQQRLGVVQHVSGRRKMAQVRWFDGREVTYPRVDGRSPAKALALGPLSARNTPISLYDIVAPAPSHSFHLRRGDLAIIIPSDNPPREKMLLAGQPIQLQTDWFGQIIDFDLAGNATIRLGAAAEVRDITVPFDRVMVVASDRRNIGIQLSHKDTGQNTADEVDLAEVENPVAHGGAIAVGDGGRYFLSRTADGDAAGRYAEREKCSPRTLTDRPFGFEILDSPPPTDHAFYQSKTNVTSDLLRRIEQEHFLLREVLPENIFVRTWADRLDMLRILIVGTADTPYEHAPFVVDFHLRQEFPAVSPGVYFHSWTDNNEHIHPYLPPAGNVPFYMTKNALKYDGKWSANSSSLRQMIVTLQEFVSVKEPYYDIAAVENFAGSDVTRFASMQYTEVAYIRAKNFIKTALIRPPGGIEDLITWLYLSSHGRNLLEITMTQCEEMMSMDLSFETLASPSREHCSPPTLSAGAVMLLKRALMPLKLIMKLSRCGETLRAGELEGVEEFSGRLNV